MHELGLERLRSVFKLVPKEYPTTRQMGSSLENRARDLMAAFQDSQNKAVIATIGGIDQILMLKYLDEKVFLSNPKPFFGFSDNTHFVQYLWKLGIPAYYGGSILTQYAFHQAIPAYTEKYLRHALFESGEFELATSDTYNDIGLDWSVPENLEKSRVMEPNEGWYWDGEARAEGILWGGCLESMVAQLGVSTYLPDPKDLDGTMLFLETSEEIPDSWVVMYVLLGFGERGWFDKFKGVLIARPKAWDFKKQNNSEAKAAYKKEQRETIIKTIRRYNPQIPIVQNLDFGHTDPQFPVPSGQRARIDGTNKNILVDY